VFTIVTTRPFPSFWKITISEEIGEGSRLPCSVPNGTEHGIFLRHGNGSKYCACTLEFDTVECNTCVYLIIQRLPVFYLLLRPHSPTLDSLSADVKMSLDWEEFVLKRKHAPKLIHYTAVTMHGVKSYFDTVLAITETHAHKWISKVVFQKQWRKRYILISINIFNQTYIRKLFVFYHNYAFFLPTKPLKHRELFMSLYCSCIYLFISDHKT